MRLKLVVGGDGDAGALAQPDAPGGADGAGVRVEAMAGAGATVGQLACRLQSLLATAASDSDAVFSAVSPDAVAPVTLRHRGLLLGPATELATGPIMSGDGVEIVPVASPWPRHGWRQAPAMFAECTQGLAAGGWYALWWGDNDIGRDPGCAVPVADQRVSRRHARLHIGAAGVTVTDLGSLNGTMVAGERLARSGEGSTRSLRDHDVIKAGGHAWVLHPADRLAVGRRGAPGAATGAPPARLPAEAQRLVAGENRTEPSGDATRDQRAETGGVVTHLRCARLRPRYVDDPLMVPEPPPPSDPGHLPIMALLTPVVLSLGMLAMTRSVIALAMVVISPLMMAITHAGQRWVAKRAMRRRTAGYLTTIAGLDETLDIRRGAEVRVREAQWPATARLADAAVRRDALLWASQATDDDVGGLRLGSAVQPAWSAAVGPPGAHEQSPCWSTLDAFVIRSQTIGPVPVAETLAAAGCLGFAGGEAARAALAAGIIQLAVRHAPVDLCLAAVADNAGASWWEWLAWLPHLAGPDHPLRGRNLAAGPEAVAGLITELERCVGDRATAAAGGGRSWPLLVVVVVAAAPADQARLLRLMRDGPQWRVHVLWWASCLAAIPASCATVVDATGTDGRAAVMRAATGERIDLASLEMVSRSAAEAVARALAPVVDAASGWTAEPELAEVVALSMLSDDDVVSSADAVMARWERSGSGTDHDLGAVVGAGRSGPMRLALREHGPHALVGGTTGAGKSEFLQVLIGSLAATHSPARLTFLLVDYKGGAAFAGCVDLPHTVGLVTDLSPGLVHRALTSLRAELRFRERLLAECGVKDLVALERRGDPRCPPALVIVIDEFAALVADVPAFVDGVVDIAQRGRSLGLHLVLATQRPTGVIRENLRANTNLRVALRMADEVDSRDVVGVADAAGFDPAVPGRAVAKIGPGLPIGFQVAYAGGPARSEGDGQDGAVSVTMLGFRRDDERGVRDVSANAWPRGGPPRRGGGATARSELETLVSTVRQAAVLTGCARPRRPWLPELSALIDQGTLGRELSTAERAAGALALGRQDLPGLQTQPVYAWEPAASGNLVVYGGPGAGKSTALRAVITAIGQRAVEGAGGDIVYVIDAGGGAMASMAALPMVGAVIDSGDTERVERLLSMVDGEVARRSHRGQHATDPLGRARPSAGAPSGAASRIFLVIDAVAALRERYEGQPRSTVLSALARVCALGRQVGVHVVASAERTTALSTPMAATFPHRVVLRMAEAADAMALGVPRGVAEHERGPGCGVLDGELMQFAVYAQACTVDEVNGAVAALAQQLLEAGEPRAPGVGRMPDQVSWPELAAHDHAGRPSIGIRADDLGPIGIDPSGVLAVTGPPGSGRSTAMRAMLRALCRDADPAGAMLLSAPARSELAGAVPWRAHAVGVEASGELARTIRARLASGGGCSHGDDDGRSAGLPYPDLIVIEGGQDFEGTDAEGEVVAAIKAARRAGVLVVVETEITTGAAAWQLHAEVRAARTAVLLQPEEGDGQALFRIPLPPVQRAGFPPGRGYLVSRGAVTLIQVAKAER